MRTLLAALTALMLFASPVLAAEELVLGYLCSDMKGSYSGAPQWSVETDSARDQKVLLAYTGQGNPASVFWIRDGESYYEGVVILARRTTLTAKLMHEHVSTRRYTKSTQRHSRRHRARRLRD